MKCTKAKEKNGDGGDEFSRYERLLLVLQPFSEHL